MVTILFILLILFIKSNMLFRTPPGGFRGAAAVGDRLSLLRLPNDENVPLGARKSQRQRAPRAQLSTGDLPLRRCMTVRGWPFRARGGQGAAPAPPVPP